jgi:cytochrome c biogenesis protein CcmG/thiol:disulfide interchange protein DsbE
MTDAMARSRVARFAIAVLAAGILAAACTNGGGSGHAAAATLPSSPTALPQMSYDQFKQVLGSLKGKPVLVNFWASWCGPCRAEAPVLAQLSKQYAGKVQFVGVDVADQAAAARAYIQKYRWTYPSVADPTYGIRRGFGLLGQPDTILYDTSGKQVWEAPGAITQGSLSSHLSQVTG